MTVKLLTLNVQGNKNWSRIFPLLKKENPEVICLQELFYSDFERIKEITKMKGYFSAMGYIDNSKYDPFKTKTDGLLGIGLISNLKSRNINEKYYMGNKSFPLIISGYHWDRALLYADVLKGEENYIIGTTHFEWTPDGNPNETQREAFHNLERILNNSDDFILAGDFNAPKNGEIYNKFLKSGFKDNLPEDITSTIDSKYHKNSNLSLIVDNIFSKGKYEVSNVRVVGGVSDHKAIIGEVSVKH
jgi:exonuclease III